MYIINIYIYYIIYICSHENNVSSWLSPPWLSGNSCTGHVIYDYRMLIPMNQRVFNKLSK